MEQGRDEDPKDNFVRHFLSKNKAISPIALDVYNYLQDWMGRKDFPVKPTDRISSVYGIVDEDLDDFVMEVANANDLALPKDTSYWQTPVITVEDLIRFISSFSHKSDLQ